MKRVFIIFLLISLINAGTIPLCAALEDEDDEYTAHDKFTRSAVNITTFFLEVPMTVYEVSTDENPVTGILYGIPVGFARGLVRFAVGVIELGTFPFPPYEPLMEPEYLIFEK